MTQVIGDRKVGTNDGGTVWGRETINILHKIIYGAEKMLTSQGNMN